MATCERCNNLLPRTVDQCPVCGLLIDVWDERPPEFEPPAAPGWATDPRPATDNELDPFSQAPVWGSAEQPTSTPSPSFSIDSFGATAPDGPEQQGSWPTRQEPSQEPPSYEAPFDQPASYEPPGYEPPAYEPAAYEPPDYESPAALGASFDTPGYSDANASMSQGLESFIDDPIPATDPASYVPAPAPPPPDLSTPRPQPQSAKRSPQRLGHDGAPIGAGVNPIAAAPNAALNDEQTTRTVRAFSSRIEGDIKFGQSPRHNLITSGLLVLALTTLGVGAGLGVLAASATDTVQSFEPEEVTPIATSLDLEAFHRAHGGNIVAVELSDCGVRRTVSGVASDATTVLVPWSDVKTDSTPIVTTPEGERISSQVLGWDPRTGLAVVRLSQPLAAGGFGWSGANQASAGTELVLLDPSGRADRSRTVMALGMTRNDDGIPGAIRVDDESLEPFAFAATESGELIGVVSGNGSTLIASDVLRSMAGSIKVNPTNPKSECPPPPPAPDEATDDEGN